MDKVLVLLESTRMVTKADELCRSHDLNFQVIPVPKEISPECGMAIEIDEDDIVKFKSVLDQHKIKVNFYKAS